MQGTHLNLVQHYEGVVPDHICDWIIGAFERSGDLVRRNNGPQNFNELNLNQRIPEAAQGCVPLLMRALDHYRTSFPLQTGYLPNELGLEEFRVKRYTGGTEEQFNDHVDVGDRSSAKRYLAFLFYLNDDFEGGQTIFYPGNVVEPVKGSVVVFPPMWMFPHRGMPVITGTKYIMSSYLNYL